MYGDYKSAKPKTIRKVLRQKINLWCESIQDKEVAETIKNHCIVTGGSIPSLLSGERINDFDIYFDSNAACAVVAQYYMQEAVTRGMVNSESRVEIKTFTNLKGAEEDRVVNYIPSAGIGGENPDANSDDDALEQAGITPPETAEGEELPAYHVQFISDNAITLSDNIQLITRFTGTPDEIHANFDFLHAQCWWKYRTDELVLPERALVPMMNRELIYTGSLYPVASIFRTRKFLQRGWRISAGDLLKMAIQCSEVDFTDPDQLREQLTGVDMLYLFNVIDRVDRDDVGEITHEYLIQVIDEIFH